MNTSASSGSSPNSPIRISPNARYFVDPSGAPLFWLGDTQWELFRALTPDVARRVLDDRRRKGFNAILIMLLGVDVGRFGLGSGAPYANLAGELPWLDDDPLRPNEEYFRHIDTMIRLGETTGQIFVIGVYHQWHYETITLQKARTWARWVSRRYRDVPNVIWSMYPEATATYVPVCRELAAGLQEGDDGAHLISVHPDPSVASSSFIHDEEWLDFNMIQTCTNYDEIHSTVSADYHRAPTKPVVMAEGAYEGTEFGKLQTPHHIRKQAYWTQLAGAYHVYGHNQSWQTPMDWQQWLGSPGSEHLRVFRDVITSLDGWWDMVPDQSILASGAGSGYSLNTAARPSSGQWLLAYLSRPSTVSIRLDALSSGGTVRAFWIDTASGDRRPAGVFTSRDSQGFTSPQGWEDALLYAEGE